ncbi:MAG TPA: FAD binding domain-containing protein [Tepidisphaeraceae bacterium]|jgi:CO/xanthine dehydrogenase FAD-binding subunit|nr:FAD binding domain-containing protein [Tepidisphaeraceae bacterium]
MHVLRPNSLADALHALAADPKLTPIAGGTDLFVSWPSRSHENVCFLDLSLLKDLRPFRLTPTHLELGALTTYWDLLTNPDITKEFPLLTQAARLVGAIQIQTRGTWAGNIANASPAADGVPALMACDATVVLCSAKDGTTEIPLDSYYTAYRKSHRRPDQLITAIKIPRRPRTQEYFYKVGARSAQAITKVGIAMLHDSTGWRIIVNSVAPTILRLRTLESALNNHQRFDSPDSLLPLLTKDIAPIDDIRSTAAYRTTVLSRLLYFRLQGLAQ